MFNYIFFDLDGTLTNPETGITKSVMYALEKYGIKEDKSNLLRFIGPPLKDSFRDFYGFDDDKCMEAIKYYRERYGTIGLFENEVYCGIIDVLKELKENGRKLYVATSKPTFFSKQIMDRFGLAEYFEYLSGSDLSEKNSDKALVIKAALDYCKAPKDEVLMVGDRKYDIIGAQKNGIKSAGVLYGFGTRKELCGAGADFIFENVNDLKKILEM